MIKLTSFLWSSRLRACGKPLKTGTFSPQNGSDSVFYERAGKFGYVMWELHNGLQS